MRSRLFSSFDPTSDRNKEFAKDLAVFVSVNPEFHDRFAAAVVDLSSASTDSQQDAVFAKIEKDLDLNRLVAGSAYGMAQFLVRQWLKKDLRQDSAEEWSDDLQELGLLDEAESAVFRTFVEKLREIAYEPMSKSTIRRRTETGILPSLKSFGSTVEMRVIVDNPFDSSMDAETYQADVVGLVPVISVVLAFDSGLVRDISFQLSRSELELLVAELRSAIAVAERTEQLVSLAES